MGTTVHLPAARTYESADLIFGVSPVLRAERMCRDAARLCRAVLTRPAKKYAPYLSPQTLSDLRTRGGVVARVGAVMLAEPRAAQEIAALVQGFADSVDVDGFCVISAARENQHDDSRQDDARSDLLAAVAEGTLSPEQLRAVVDACDAQIASTRSLRNAAAAQLAELERGS